MNIFREFDSAQIEAVGKYVYALIDPRDAKVFYVGQGRGNRVFNHFNEVDQALTKKLKWSAKRRRIYEIWEEGLDVNIKILRRNLSDESIDHIEAAVIDALSISQNGPLLNLQTGNKFARHGGLSFDELESLTAPAFNPKSNFKTIFVFPISKGLERADDVYEATRKAWSVSSQNRNYSDALAVGVSQGISKGTFKIDSWSQWPSEKTLWMFNGTEVDLFKNESFKTIISAAIGYWQRGNYLVIEVKDKKFRFIYGSSDKEAWLSLA